MMIAKGDDFEKNDFENNDCKSDDFNHDAFNKKSGDWHKDYPRRYEVAFS